MCPPTQCFFLIVALSKDYHHCSCCPFKTSTFFFYFRSSFHNMGLLLTVQQSSVGFFHILWFSHYSASQSPVLFFLFKLPAFCFHPTYTDPQKPPASKWSRQNNPPIPSTLLRTWHGKLHTTSQAIIIHHTPTFVCYSLPFHSASTHALGSLPPLYTDTAQGSASERTTFWLSSSLRASMSWFLLSTSWDFWS